MPCQGHIGDYSCQGWRLLAERIRKRDSDRCRGCNREADEIRLEVHHRSYGDPGPCGECVLTRVEDDDLITLCIECHDAITNVRRAARYAGRVIEIGTVGIPPAAQQPIRVKAEVTLELTPVPLATGPVVRPLPFNPLGKE